MVEMSEEHKKGGGAALGRLSNACPLRMAMPDEGTRLFVVVRWTSCVGTADSPATDLQSVLLNRKVRLEFSSFRNLDFTHFSVSLEIFCLTCLIYCQSGVLLPNFSRDTI